MYWFSVPNQRVRGTKPCNRGPDCYFLKKGQCWFYHPDEDSSRRNRQQDTIRSYLEKKRQLQKEQEEREEKEREERLRQRMRRLQRQREQRQREEAEEQAEAQRQYQRMRQLRMRRYLEDLKLQKQSSKKFQWYLSKNKSFKALEISQEKLQELDQCVICFQSYWNHQDHSHQVCNPEIKSSIESIEESNVDERKSEKPCVDSKEHLQRELTELYCKHTFHKECIRKWLLKNSKCPVCRRNFRDHEDYKKFEQEKKEQKKEDKKPELVSLHRSHSSSWLNLSRIFGELRL